MSQKNIPVALQRRNEELNKITIESVTQAFIELMGDKGFDKISITEICERAGISRNTFYKNFGTKENVFKMVVLDFNKNVLLRRLGNPFNKKAGIGWYQKFFAIIKDYSELFLAIVKSGYQYVYLTCVNELLLGNPNLDKSIRYMRLMWNGAIQNAVMDWLNNGMRESPEQMAEFCYNIMGKYRAY